MELKEFALKVRNAAANRLGADYQVGIQEVQKNNNTVLQGLMISSGRHNVAPTIYLNPFWEAYEGGVPLSVVVDRIMQIYEEDTPKGDIDMSFFKEFDRVKDRICYRLISAEKNRELLVKIPHIRYLDMAICFYYAYQGELLGSGLIPIYNSHMKMWNTSTETLFELAGKNTPALFPWECRSMEDTIREMFTRQQGDGWEPLMEEAERQEFFAAMPMRILSNANRVHGAICILYQDVLKQLAKKEGRNFYILPSSVHEVILLPDSGHENAMQLREMVVDVNATQVESEEILSDNLYYYDRFSEQITLV